MIYLYTVYTFAIKTFQTFYLYWWFYSHLVLHFQFSHNLKVHCQFSDHLQRYGAKFEKVGVFYVCILCMCTLYFMKIKSTFNCSCHWPELAKASLYSSLLLLNVFNLVNRKKFNITFQKKVKHARNAEWHRIACVSNSLKPKDI